jgi:hypothetical protein
MSDQKFPDAMPTDCPKKAAKYILDSFTLHPAELGETYLQHLKFTTAMSARLVLTGLALFIHGFMPFLFCKTTSGQSKKIRDIFVARDGLKRRN